MSHHQSMQSNTSINQTNYSQNWQQAAPTIAWGTIALFIFVVLSYWLTISQALQGQLNYFYACVICTYLAYASFTIVHDAGHGSIFASTSRFKPLEAAIGWIASISLLVTSFRFFQLIHDRHHAHTNNPDLDPDHIWADDNLLQLLASIYFIPIQYYIKLFTVYKNDPVCRQSYFSTFGYLVLVHGSLLLLAVSGFGLEVICFAYIPMLLALFALVFFFDYVPHHPHQSTHAFHNTRIYPSKIINLLLLGQNYHLVHHLYPKVPWYRYQRAYQLVKTELEAQQSPIEQPQQLLTHHNIGALLNQGEYIDGVVKVDKITRLNNLAVQIDFAINTPLNFKAGQYITVSKWIDGQQHTRCYSICSAANSNQLSITVKQIDHGMMSQYLNQQLRQGDELIIKGPFGDFYYQMPQSQQPLVLIAAGSGITPMLSILKTAIATAPDQPIELICFNRELRTTLYYQELHDLTEQYRQFKVKHYWSKTSVQSSAQRATAKQFEQLIPIENTASSHYYICGPQSLTEQLIDYLHQHRIDDRQIHTEQFNPVKPQQPTTGKTYQLELISLGQTKQILINEHQTLVEAALAQNQAINHACKRGSCGACKCQLISGEIQPISSGFSSLTESDQQAGFILACQSKAKSDLTVRC